MSRLSLSSKVVIFGSGPIVIGQACEFDYSGTQACKALMKEGYEVILINSNPATIMTDPEIATRVYVEPLKAEFVKRILLKEKPTAIIPTLGGQTALNLAIELFESGFLSENGIQLLGAKVSAIKSGEDRELFRGLLDRIGAKYPKSITVESFEDGEAAGKELGFPIILRPSYTLGGGGGGIAYSEEEYHRLLIQALKDSPTRQVLVEESILGWYEYELEVMRDRAGTFVVVCSIENFDPCGVHTGDSITIAPQQTLTDREYQAMRDEAAKVIEAVGVETGGANIQFAVHPTTRERVVIEMNPRVSRSSALASKATGFPIAKIAALLAVGYQLEELRNEITGSTPSCYEPALDYVVTKIPRFAFEKFAGSKDLLDTQMRSVGEVMGIGRTLIESMTKAMASLESKDVFPHILLSEDKLAYPNSKRLHHIFQAFRENYSIEKVNSLTGIHPFFLEQIQNFVNAEKQLTTIKDLDARNLRYFKRFGFTDRHLAELLGLSENEIYLQRKAHGVLPAYLQVDTCAGEFESSTPYFYGTYWAERTPLSFLKAGAVVVLGSGPNRIGQGIEFDYSCVRGVKALQAAGEVAVMVNSNPETVSTDYDTSDMLFFEPLTTEHVLEVMDFIKPKGFVAQLGGQTPINIAPRLVTAGYKILGSSLHSIDLAEDRKLFAEVCQEMGFHFPASGMAEHLASAVQIAQYIQYPLIARPSFVLGGQRMQVIENESELAEYFSKYGRTITHDRPCLMDHFLEGALEVDVDLVRGAGWAIVGGIVEHIEAAGVHSGDSMGVLPPQRLKKSTSVHIEELCLQLADRLDIIGHLNLQLAIKDDTVFMLEANPRSSRSVPFVAKATKIPLVDLAMQAMLGKKPDISQYNWRNTEIVSVKGVALPFKKFKEADSILGPEMKSTGESMGRGLDYSEALLKAYTSTIGLLPKEGTAFLSLREVDKKYLLPMAQGLQECGFKLLATRGTAVYLIQNGIDCESVRKVHEGRPNCVDLIRSGKIDLVVNTTSGRTSIEASFDIRRSCVDYNIPCLTESDAALAFLIAMRKNQQGEYSAISL